MRVFREMTMKFKFIIMLVFLAVFVPIVCQADSLIFTEDGTIDGGTYDDVTIMSTAEVSMNNGSVGNMYIQDLGKLNYYNGTINQTELRDSAKLNLEGASFSSLKLFNSGEFNLNSGTYSGLLEKYEYCQTNINGGQVLNGGLLSYNYGITNIYDGSVTWDGVDLYQDSVLNIYGGDVLFTNGFWLDDNAEINVFYSDIIRLKPEDPLSQILGYYLLDGSEFMLDQFSYAEIEQINFVPEPATLLLLGLGGALLRKRK